MRSSGVITKIYLFIRSFILTLEKILKPVFLLFGTLGEKDFSLTIQGLYICFVGRVMSEEVLCVLLVLW